MLLNTALDVDVVAVEGPETVTLLVQLTAPTVGTAVKREPSALVVVLDRSGSMGGPRLEGAKRSLLALVDRLAPTDRFGLVTFDDSVQLVVPCAPLVDKASVKAQIAAISAGGSTDLSAGYLRGLREAQRRGGAKTASTTVVLVSDGHANAGVTDPDQLGSVAAKASGQGVTTTTLGFGLGYDETLLGALARGGSGNELFAETPDEAIVAMAAEVDGILDQSVQAASLLVRMTPACHAVQLQGDLPATMTDDGLLVELGSFWSGEQRKLVLRLQVPGLAALGLAQIAQLELTSVELPGLVESTTTVPVHVNVVPGDQLEGRVTNDEVLTELAFQQTQDSKRRASSLLSRGDTSGALDELHVAHSMALSGSVAHPDAAFFADEVSTIAALIAETRHGDVRRAAKMTSVDTAMKSRRGRASRRT